MRVENERMLSIFRKYFAGVFCAEYLVMFEPHHGICLGDILLSHETGAAWCCVV